MSDAASNGIFSANEVYALARAAGATPDEAVILTAIARAESSWNPRSHYQPGTGEDSYGLWQINMDPKYAAGRRQQFGIASNTDLYDPQTNAKAALAILRSQGLKAWSTYTSGKYSTYMPAAKAAAAAVGDQVSANLPTGSTVGGVSGSPISGGGDTSGGLPPNATPEQLEAYVRDRWPAEAGFLDVPELRDVFIQSAQKNYSEGQLEGALFNTAWWKAHGSDSRNWLALQKADPAEAEAEVQREMAVLAPQVADSGLRMDVRAYANNVLLYGWTDAQIQQDLATRLRMQSSATGLKKGSAPEVEAEKLATIATSEYYLPMNPQDTERWAIDIGEGRKTEDDYRQYLSTMSAGRFPGLKDQGITPGQYMAPIVNTIAQTLELQPGDVNLLSPAYSKVLQVQQSDGTFRPMTLNEAQQWARDQPAFKTTKGALDQASAFGETLLQRFGAVAT